MSNRVLNDFFKNQIEEHLRVTEKCKSDLLKPFINVVDICCNSLKKWKRVFFVELDPMRDRELIITFINGKN